MSMPQDAQTAEVVDLKVREIVARALDLELDQVSLSASLTDELGAQSLDMLDMAFMFEREFRISFPRTDILERATAYFGEDALVHKGVVTDFGRTLLAKGMPELEPARLTRGIRAAEVVKMVTVQTMTRLVHRLLQAKAEFSRQCPACGTVMAESDVMPEFICASCGKVQPLPSGDEILLQDLIALSGGLQPVDPPRPGHDGTGSRT